MSDHLHLSPSPITPNCPPAHLPITIASPSPSDPDNASPSYRQVFRPRAAPERPYRIDQAAATAQIPQPSRGVLTKLQSYIFGM